MLHGHFFSSFRFETLYRVSTLYYGVCVKIFCDFVHSGPNYGQKGVFSNVRLSHFLNIFCGKGNVIVCYMGTFFQAMVLKLCTGFLVHITNNLWFIMIIFFKMGLRHFFNIFYSKVNIIVCYMGTFFKLWLWNFALAF